MGRRRGRRSRRRRAARRRRIGRGIGRGRLGRRIGMRHRHGIGHRRTRFGLRSQYRRHRRRLGGGGAIRIGGAVGMAPAVLGELHVVAYIVNGGNPTPDMKVPLAPQQDVYGVSQAPPSYQEAVGAAPSAPIMPQPANNAVPLDTTGDGKVDAVGIDTTNDGQLNMQGKLVDTTGDGKFDHVAADTTGDGVLDSLILSWDDENQQAFEMPGQGVAQQGLPQQQQQPGQAPQLQTPQVSVKLLQKPEPNDPKNYLELKYYAPPGQGVEMKHFISAIEEWGEGALWQQMSIQGVIEVDVEVTEIKFENGGNPIELKKPESVVFQEQLQQAQAWMYPQGVDVNSVLVASGFKFEVKANTTGILPMQLGCCNIL